MSLDIKHLHAAKPRRHHDGTFDVYGQLQKIKEEFDEVEESSIYWNDQPTGKNREKQLEELIDLQTAVYTYAIGAGYTQEEIEIAICMVNCKNKLRGYWEDGHDGL